MPERKVVSRSRSVDPNLVGKKMTGGYVGSRLAEWACSSCGKSDNPGNVKLCENCGSPQEADEQFKSTQNKGAYLTEKQMSDMGVDRRHGDEICPYCGGHNKPGTATCANCGGDIDDTARTSQRCPSCGTETNNTVCPNCGDNTASKKPKVNTENLSRLPQIEPAISDVSFNLSGLLKYWWIPAIVVALGVLIFALWPRQATARVDHVAWTYTVYQQEYQYVYHDGWSSPPSDAKEVTSERKYKETIQVKVGEKDVDKIVEECEDVYDYTEHVVYSDGTEEDIVHTKEVCENVTKTVKEDVMEDKDVYDTWYTYYTWEWVTVNPAVTNGTTTETYWPTVVQDNTHRASGTNESYTTYFVMYADDETRLEKSYTPDSLQEFQSLAMGTSWSITYSGNTVTKVELAP